MKRNARIYLVTLLILGAGIVLDIGLDMHILSPRVFAMMVIMALVTTFMTGPLLSASGVLRRKAPAFGAVA